MLLRLQQGPGNGYCSRLLAEDASPVRAGAAGPLLQRDGTIVKPKSGVESQIKGKSGAKLSGTEAVHRLELKLFAEDGFFSTLHRVVGRFKDDMKTELGWYAGDKKASGKKKTGLDAATQAVVGTAKTKAKEAITDGLKLLASQIPKVGGPASTAAGIVAGVLWSQFDKIAEYDPVVTELAQVAPHQHYIEALEGTLAKANRELQVTLTENEDEMAAGPLDDVKALTTKVDEATNNAEKTFYFDVVQGYRAVAPARTVELETPHARWSGEKRGLYGGGTYVTPIKSGTVYVEFKAKGVDVDDIQIVKTVVPELPKDVLGHLNESDPSLTLGHLAGTAQMLIEGATGSWQIRIVREPGGKLVPADQPSYTKQYLREVAKARGAREATMEGESMNGATFVYAKIITTPLKDANLSV